MILALLMALGGIAVVLVLGWGLVVAGRYRLTAVVGQTGGRLRVVRVPVVSGGSAGAGRPARAERAADRR
jgi:hypothetical protein